MYGFFLDHFQRFVITLNLCVYHICMYETFQDQNRQRGIFSIFAHLVSTSVSVLLAKAMHLLFSGGMQC